ncbi:hypothetical protein [Thermogutta sp.]|jgi:hypothetical protein|uniref:hypothetical protein n=1 Tax=Thermogutta sp. TaxID=1962930 RepID=UPI00321FCE2B
MYDIDFAPLPFWECVVRSAQKRWPGHEIRRIRRRGQRRDIYSYGVIQEGAVIAYAKVNRAGAVQWIKPWPSETWEVCGAECTAVQQDGVKG